MNRRNFQNTPMDGFSGPVTHSAGLVSRVYGLLSLTLLISALSSVYAMHSTLVTQHYWALVIVSFILLFATQFAGRSRSFIAVPLVFMFAATMGAIMGPGIAMYLRMPDGPTIVTEALGATTVLFVGLSMYGAVTRRDFSHIGGFLLTGLIVGIIVSLANAFVLHMPVLQSAVAGVFVLVFSGLIVFDTQRLMQQRDTAVVIVIELYLDIINLFMALLEILGAGGRD